MKNGKKISLCHPKLKKLRSSLRDILTLAVYREIENLEAIDFSIMKNEGANSKNRLEKEISQLNLTLKRSICSCSLGSACRSWNDVITEKLKKREYLDNLNLIYDSENKSWYCDQCYKYIVNKRNKKHWFNQGIITNEKAKKPCHELKWCPYGSFVERFPLRRERLNYSCLVFGHDCPIFYILGKFTEDTEKIPPPNKRLAVDQNWLVFNREREISDGTPKPCYKLKYCPYGPIVDYSKEPKKLAKSTCILYMKDCPAFYLSQEIMEDIDF